MIVDQGGLQKVVKLLLITVKYVADLTSNDYPKNKNLAGLLRKSCGFNNWKQEDHTTV